MKQIVVLLLAFGSVTCVPVMIAAEVTIPAVEEKTDAAAELVRLRALAESGDVKALWALARTYAGAPGGVKGFRQFDGVEATKWYRKAAEQGHPEAQFEMGRKYELGVGVPKDEAEATKWFQMAGENGLAKADKKLGDMYRHRFLEVLMGDKIEAEKWHREEAKWYLKAAEQGDKGAQTRLAHVYREGFGVPEDAVEAAKWYRKAAEQGDESAQYELGKMLTAGEGVPKDEAEALTWYRRAADQDYGRALNTLGNMYADGNGVPQDVVEAVKWFRRAADGGDKDGQYYLGLMYAHGRGVPRDEAEAVKWFRMAASGSEAFEQHPGAKIELSFISDPAMRTLKQAADSGNADAQFRLGEMFLFIKNQWVGSWNNFAEAASWYRKAADQDEGRAQARLGRLYKDGFRIPKDLPEAARLLRKAAEKGIAYAQRELGSVYELGEGLPKNSVEAAKCYRKAAEQGDTEAQGYLGGMYADGEGVPKDTIEGLAWSNIAAASGEETFVRNRDMLERRVGPEMTLAAQQRSKQILKEIEAAKRASSSSTPKDSATAISPADETPKASGSGTIVSAAGHVLTAAHVIAGASRVKIFTAQGMKTASVLRIDEANDLAVLKLAGGIYLALPVAPSRRIRLGQTVATIGFPNVEIQGFSPKVTRGEISSLNGIGDDPRAWQISVPVQPGNSGGPLLDENGNVIGVVVSKLGLKAAQATGDIPQNVNYAVKSTYALALLEPYLDSSAPEPNQSAAKPRFEDMVAKAQQSVVLILVY